MAIERSLHGPAARLAGIEPFHVMALLGRAQALAAGGRDIVHMQVGEPDFPTPDPIVAAAKVALEQGRTHYTASPGMAELRAAIAQHYRERHGVAVAPERIVVTPGSSVALAMVMAVLVNPGEQVLLSDPGYPCNRHFVRLFEGAPIGVPVGPEDHYQLTRELVAQHATDRSVAVLLASPANPTGTLVQPEKMAAIIDWAHGRGLRVVVDEIYQGLVYGHAPSTALGLSDEVFVVNSFSKYYGMTGWRLGWVVAPEGFVEPLETLAQNLYLAAPTIAQHAALEAFSPQTLAILEERRRELEARRDYLVPALRDLGFSVPVVPDGAFYVYAGCERFADDSYALATALLEQAGVAVTPGIDFGSNAPNRHLRFAYTTSVARLEEGVGRIADYLR